MSRNASASSCQFYTPHGLADVALSVPHALSCDRVDEEHIREAWLQSAIRPERAITVSPNRDGGHGGLLVVPECPKCRRLVVNPDVTWIALQ